MGNVADKLGKLAQTKADIRAAIMEKGQTVEETEPFAAYPEKIRAISGGAQINQAREVQVVAANQIQAGDTVYTISGDYAPIIKSDSKGSMLNNAVQSAAFSPDGKALVLVGNFLGYAKVYAVNGTMVTYVSDLYADAGTKPLNGAVQGAAFSPDGKTLVLVGNFLGRAKIYSVNGTTVTYVSDLYADVGTTALNNLVQKAVFSPDGKTLVLVGNFLGRAKIYSVNGTTVTYVSDLYADAGATALNNQVQRAVFSPDGKRLVLVGLFAGYAKVYAVNGTAVTYISDLYADAGTTALNNAVQSAAFSPDGKTLVLVGNFAGYAKVYSVNETEITYVGPIALNGSVRWADFSPDGKVLVLVGAFTGIAKVYAVDGTTVTYVSDIYADAGTGVFVSAVHFVAFSPGGEALILVGEMYGRAVMYCVNGTSIKYAKRDDQTAYLPQNGEFRSPGALISTYGSIGVGYAKTAMSVWEEGAAVLIGTLVM